MKLLFALSLLLIGTVAHPSPELNCQDGLLVSTQQGLVRGKNVHDRVDAFLGVPYANPPVGALRFEPPQPLDNQPSRAHVLDATQFGPVCHQFHYRTVMGDLLLETSGQSEDCLTLNIFVPRNIRKASVSRLPVYVWSYGGAFGEGGGSVPLFNPTNLVAETNDIIVVTWNYRVNIFGFPNSPALKSQNLGLRDQRVALEWIRDNIAGFGGDPDQIILGGQSAGADSGSAMVYSHADDPIFAGLALQSGTVQIIGALTDDFDSEFVRVANSVGCANAGDRSKELECMRWIDAERLQRAVSNETFNLFGSPAGGTPMVDNVVIFSDAEYIHRGRMGEFAKVPTLMGMMNNEFDSVLNWSEDCGVNKTLSRLGTALVFDCNVALEAGFRSLYNVPVWRYRYMGVFPKVTPYSWLGAYHQADVPMLMGTYNLLLGSEERETNITVEASHYFQQIFRTFIRDPAHGLERIYGWPTYTPNTTTSMELFNGNTISTTLKSSERYDLTCRDPAPFPWLEVVEGPPKC